MLRSNDIVALQEIMLLEEDTYLLSDIDPDFDFATVPSKLNGRDGMSGRPVGGLAILWRRSLSIDFIPVIFSDHFLVIKLVHDNYEYVIFNVYLPCDTHTDTVMTDFNTILAEIECVLNELNINNCILLGDFNADPHKGRFWPIFKRFTDRLSLFIVDLCMPIDTFTYLSPSHNTTSWLDHVVTTHNDLISNISVGYNMAIYDHFPLSMQLNMKSAVTVEPLPECQNLIKSFVDWKKMTPVKIQEYQDFVSENLLHLFNEGLMCKSYQCSSVIHKIHLQKSYDALINILLSSSSKYSFSVKRRHKVVPGWNDCCKTLYHIARNKFLIWKNKGKCRYGLDFEEMKSSRKNFKESLAACKKNEEYHRNAALASSYAKKNMNQFWKSIIKVKGGLLYKQINKMDNRKGNEGILETFKTKYQNILDNSDCQTMPQNFMADFTSYVHGSEHCFKIRESQVREAVNSLNHCIDFDGIHANHLKLGPLSLFKVIAKLLSTFITHSFLPDRLLKGQIRPIIKNNLGDLTSSDNYRPVMVSSNFLKVLEYCLMPDISNCVELNSRQFGFRKNTSTLMAIAMLKETVNSYITKGSCVYASFLDLSRAFDRVNYYKLISKLIHQKVPPSIINILYAMYSNQNVYVSFNNQSSNIWKIGNGVRQGGILSPLLFNIYINDIISHICKLNIGCKLGINILNVLAYADDICLLCPTSSGLQKLLDVIYALLGELDLRLNTDKSVCMIFRAINATHSLYMTNFYVNGSPIQIVEYCKYLGVILTNNLCNAKDIERCEASFYQQFYSVYRKFYSLDPYILLFLFKTYCTSFYGAELWHNNFNCSQILKRFGIGYHKVIKKIWGVSTRASNHEVCISSNLLTFNHFVNLRLILFVYRFLNCNSVCMYPHKTYFIYNSYFLKNVNHLLINEYGVTSGIDNDIDAIKSRVTFVNYHEDRLR